jgi:hypothetical protein
MIHSFPKEKIPLAMLAIPVLSEEEKNRPRFNESGFYAFAFRLNRFA